MGLLFPIYGKIIKMFQTNQFRNIWENVGKSMNFVEVLIYVNIKIIMMMTPG